MVCRGCGIVSESSLIDQQNETRIFTNAQGVSDASSNRVQAVTNPHLQSAAFNTQISGNNMAAKEYNNRHFIKIDGQEKNFSDG